MTLQALYGTIPQIFGKGECARVRQMLLLKKCILFFGTALRSLRLNARVGFLNPAFLSYWNVRIMAIRCLSSLAKRTIFAVP